MKPVSHLLRGQFYTTHLTARCGNYHRCILCGGCRHYDGNNLTCRVCESSKAAAHCRCKPKSLMAVRLITQRMGFEMLHPDMPRSARVVTLEENPELVQFIEDNIGPVQSS